MAKDISTTPGMGTDPNYLNGNIVDNQTKVASQIHQDIIQFFQKLMDLARMTANDLNDNEANGYQFIQALQYNSKAYRTWNTHVSPSSNILTVPEKYDLSEVIFIDPSGSSMFNRLNWNPQPDGGRLLFYSLATKIIESGGNLILPGGSMNLTIEPYDLVLFEKDPQYDKYYVSIINKSIPINEKIIEIGDWNMYANPSLLVSLGFPANRIRFMSAIIRDDNNDVESQLSRAGNLNIKNSTNPNDIFLQKDTGGIFDSTDYQATSYNRGWIYIKYV